MTPITLKDAELLRLMVVAGDEGAFADLYRRHQSAVYRFALLMSGRPNIAEEVTQEVFLTLIREPHRFDPSRGMLPAFLYGVARNYVLRIIRRERPYVPLVEGSENGAQKSQFIAQNDPFRDCTRNEIIKLVRTAVLSLPTRYREVVVLCDFQEMTGADAAVALGCAIGTVNSRLHRGHILLLQKLRGAGKLGSPSKESQLRRCLA